MLRSTNHGNESIHNDKQRTTNTEQQTTNDELNAKPLIICLYPVSILLIRFRLFDEVGQAFFEFTLSLTPIMNKGNSDMLIGRSKGI